ncbi:MAG: PAS domain S-box protein [Chitinivibrionales bacterium]|nr:PAS domain S-box protein [Chitinivibrionales bacterium]MBD3396249.1 PAS domain S-box protein [Chitinivibrionales bacterium]
MRARKSRKAGEVAKAVKKPKGRSGPARKQGRAPRRSDSAGREGPAGLVNSEQQLRSLVNAITESALLLDGEGRILVANEVVASRFGSTPASLEGRSIYDVVGTDEVDKWRHLASNVAATGKPAITEAERDSRSIVVSVCPVWGEEGRVAGFAVFAKDITESKRAQERLRTEEERYRTLIGCASDIIQVTSAEGIITYLSPSVERILGFKPAQLEGKPSVSVVHPDDLPDVRKGFEKAFAKPGTPVYTVCRCRHKDGTWRVLGGWGTNHLDNPAIRGFVANTRDITDDVEAQRQLRASEEKFRSVVEQSLDGVTLIDDTGTIIEFNRGQEIISGIHRKDALGKKVWDVQYGLIPRERRTRQARTLLREQHESMLRTGDSSWLSRLFEVELERVDGSRRTLQTAVFPIEIGERRIFGSINRDITEVKKAQETIERREKELAEQNVLLQNKNVALKELMSQVEAEKARLAGQVRANVQRIVLPVLARARLRCNDTVRRHLDMLEDNLADITSVFGSQISDRMLRLTPREVELCAMIRRGATSKEIARLLDISHRTVEIHRNRIRRKLGIREPGINLATYLETLAS